MDQEIIRCLQDDPWLLSVEWLQGLAISPSENSDASALRGANYEYRMVCIPLRPCAWHNRSG